MQGLISKAAGAAAACAAVAVLGACGGDSAEGEAQAGTDDPLAQTLADGFRMDVSTIETTYDFDPASKRLRGETELTFQMRPGQTQPLFHFNPIRGGGEQKLGRVELDGDLVEPSEIDYKRPGRKAERAYVIDRQVDTGIHTIEVSWNLPKSAPPPNRRWLFPIFDDTQGPDDETETMWPTVSSPDELATHITHINVKSNKPYRVIGSGEVEKEGTTGNTQSWTAETPATVSSSNVFFAAVPASDYRLETIEVEGVEVEILSNQGRERDQRAKRTIRDQIPKLIDFFGPFPVDKLSIFLTGWGSGMEYYGATRTGLGALRHELGHMYFATTAINRTWRDTWLDEAIVSWWEAHRRIAPLDPKSRGDLLNRPVLEPGFNTAAYGKGARVMETVARGLGGDDAMFEFLTELHATREFEPFTTEDFVDDVMAADPDFERADLERWIDGAR